MHLRRALLLFVIVVGMAALAASLAQPPGDESQETDREPPRARGTPRAEPAPKGAGVARLRFVTGGRRERLRLEAGRPASVDVEVPEAGQVELVELGLTAPAEPATPAHFDVLAPGEQRIQVVFRPADGDEPRLVGTLVIEAGGTT